MYQIGQTPLATLRPEKLDDVALKQQIGLIQGVCGDIDPDLIAIVFHECDYNIQSTITRIQSGDFENGGWQTAKSNHHKKKTHPTNPSDQSSNNGIQSDSERSLSQHTSPTPSLRGGINRERRGKTSYSNNINRRNVNHSKDPTDHIKSVVDVTSSSDIQEKITPIVSSSIDEYEFSGGTSQSLTFDNSQKKNSVSSMIPQKAVCMHKSIRFSHQPIDIQFGDVQWNDSVPIAITPSNSPMLTKSSDEQTLDAQNHPTTNIPDRELQETTDVLSPTSFEITNNPLTTNSTEEISHLSDHINESSQQLTSPSTSQTPHQFLPNTSSSAFTPYGTSTGNFQTMARDYSQTWNTQQSPNYKPKLPTGTYQPLATSYSVLPQQQYYVGPYPYQTPAYYPMITSVDPWSTATYESYPSYATTNYVPTYPAQQQQQQYHPNTRHDSYGYDKEFFGHYGQTRPTNNTNELSASSQKEPTVNSKLSATAASFSQATSPTNTLYVNQTLYTYPTYYPTQQERTMTYPSMDNRDHRNGASYAGNNRTHYYQQQRSHPNSTWHKQQ